MAVNTEAFKRIRKELDSKNVTLVAVSKTKSPEDILELYHLGQRDFGENYVQELTGKYEQLPKDIRWHFIGHLQSNKVKYIAPFISLVHSVDSQKLLKEINKEARKNDRVIDCLLQIYIAKEETKFGLDEGELHELAGTNYTNAHIAGLMGMASFTDDMEKVREEFKVLKSLFDKYAGPGNENFDFKILSMGMSADYNTAIEEGSTYGKNWKLAFWRKNVHQQVNKFLLTFIHLYSFHNCINLERIK